MPVLIRIVSVLSVLLCLIPSSFAATSVTLVSNINKVEVTPTSPGFFFHEGYYYFANTDEETGRELWRTDGTDAGTTRVADIRLGPLGSSPSNFAGTSGTVFFTADNGVTGQELWKTDGTAAGTVLVKDIMAGATASNPSSLVPFLGEVFFGAGDVWTGYRLWRSNGTDAGTTQVSTALFSSSPSSLVVVAGKLFFTGSDGSYGSEPWVSNGTNGGTFRLADINPGTNTGFYGGFTPFGNRVVFQGDAGTAAGIGSELWISDGTTTGTNMVRDIYTGTSSGIPNSSAPANFCTSGSQVFFSARNASGVELWVTDGTSLGTVLVRDIRSGSASSSPRKLVANGTYVLFAATGTNGQELWRTNGTLAGTVEVQDIRPGALGSGADNLITSGTETYFIADNGTSGTELWKSDGNSTGTFRLTDIAVGDASSTPSFVATGGQRAVMVARDELGNWEYWATQDAPETVQRFATLRATTLDANPELMRALGQTLLFRCDDGIHGVELWKSDGTDEGTTIVADIVPGATGSTPNYLTVFQGQMFFHATTPGQGRELWKTDGTEAGTTIVRDLFAGPSNGLSLMTPTVFNGRLYFPGTDGSSGVELWSTDGTNVGTTLVKDIVTGTGDSSPGSLTVSGSKLFFVASTPATGGELWVTDGTGPGTQMVKDIYAGTNSGTFGFDLRAFGDGRIWFPARTAASGEEPWISDGTSTGTFMLQEHQGGTFSSLPRNTALVGNKVFYGLGDGTPDYDLWMTDGTPAGTIGFVDFNPGWTNYVPDSLTAFNDLLLMSVRQDGSTGIELWRCDGTTVGTQIVSDINPGTAWGSPIGMTPIGGICYLSAEGPGVGRELYMTDGTDAGTTLVADAIPGSGWLNPSLMALGGRIYCSGATLNDGRELWRTVGAVPPTNARAAAITLDSITWQWRDNSSAPEQELGFRVNHGPGTAAPIASWTDVASDSTQWAATGLATNTQYAFRVAARDNGGSGIRTPDVTTYTAIESVSALTFPSVTTASISAVTATSHSNLSIALSGVRYTNTTVATQSSWLQNTAPWVSTSLTPNTQYSFTGVSRNGSGVLTTPASASVYTLAIAPLPTALNSVTSHGLTATVTPGIGNPTSTQYAVRVAPSVAGNPWLQTDGSFGASPAWRTASAWGGAAVEGLDPETTYVVAVRARNGDGVETAESLSTTVTLPLPPSTPIMVAASSVTTGTATWQWIDTATSETGFRAWHGAGDPPTVPAATVLPANATVFVTSALTPDTTLSLRLTAFNAGGESAPSAWATTVTLAALPIAPVVDDATSRSLRVTVPADTNATHTVYAVRVSPSVSGQQWLQPGGATGAAPFYQSRAVWGQTTVTGLNPNTLYQFRTTARNSAGVPTAESSAGSATTLIGNASVTGWTGY